MGVTPAKKVDVSQQNAPLQMLRPTVQPQVQSEYAPFAKERPYGGENQKKRKTEESLPRRSPGLPGQC